MGTAGGQRSHRGPPPLTVGKILNLPERELNKLRAEQIPMIFQIR